MFEDISEFYTPERALSEEVQWLLTQSHEQDAAFLLPLIEQYEVTSILEAGCGSGILASLLPPEVDYLGVDKNAWFLERARTRNGPDNLKRVFTCWDVRNYEPLGQYDLVMAFAFFKHFSLEEFDTLVARVLSWGKHGALGFQVTDHDLDNGTEFHHTFTTEERVRQAIKAGGHDEIEMGWNVISEFDVPGEGKAQTVLVWTSQKKLMADPYEGTGQIQILTDKGVEPAIWKNSVTPAPMLCVPLSAKQEAPIGLEVAGVLRPDLWRYSLRFNSDGTPTLYQNGKRLTCPWRIKMDWQQAADEQGGNANTAGES